MTVVRSSEERAAASPAAGSQRNRPDTHLADARPVVPAHGAWRPLGLAEVRLVGGFWAQRQAVNGEASLPHSRSWLERLGWIGNFTAAREGKGSRRRRGRQFSDSEVYKLLEAMAWEYGRTADPALDAEIRELTAYVAAAQTEDGYVGTAFGGPGQANRYSDLAEGHELYCAGHLLQAAVARARTVGPDDLLDIAVRLADHVCVTFGPSGVDGICGHPEIETALVELYRVTGNRRYLDQAALFVERRGHRSLPPSEFGWRYASDDIPVRRAQVLRGHAVRALYLAAGAVDVAVETGDDELLAAVAHQFDATLARRTYVTGGMGSHHADEAFGEDFELPPDRAYSETCAGVASAMLAWRLLLATGEPRYADAIERVLYNVVATSIADDGRAFFYANTLHQRALPDDASLEQERLAFGNGARAPWYEVSCCLQNAARLLASLAGYVATVDSSGLQLHQYADADLRASLGDGRPVGLEVRTAYPDDGAVVVTVTDADGSPWDLALRIPAWADGARLEGEPVNPGTMAIVRRAFAPGDTVRLDLPMAARWQYPDPRIDAVRGCVTLQRGPVVYCAESTKDDLDLVRVDPTGPLREEADGVVVTASIGSAAAGWPYRATSEPPADTAHTEPRDIRLIPYHRWGRQGPSTMRVWLPRA